jgi:hypothetical protein
MFMRYLNLAILASTVVLSRSASDVSANSNGIARQLADFAWEIEPEDGYPVIAVDDANEESEVVFKYNYTGTLSANKYLGVNLYQNDCITAADASLAFINTTTGDELDIDLDIIQETISNSVHYQDINPSTAIIEFCLRVDYNYIDGDGLTESINFYETIVTITVDLTANFTLTAVSVARFPADSETANFKLDYPVEAYICLDDNSEVGNPTALEQGSILQVCVKIDDTVVTENVVVEDILTFVVSQPDGPGTDSKTIANGVSDPLTDKVCRESGICNVKTQLLSKFFTETIPGDLRVDGMAILAFGKASLMPSSAPTSVRRRLRAPIRGLLTSDDVKVFMATQENNNNNNNNNRDNSSVSMVSVVADSSQRMMLQEGALFGLAVGLQGNNGDSSGGSTVVVAAIFLIMLSAGCGYAGFRFGTKKSRKETKDMMDHDASVGGTYPSEASLFSSSSSQPGSPRRTRDQHSSNASAGGTYPTDASVFSSSSSHRHGSPRRTRDQHSSNASAGGTYPSEPPVLSSPSSRHSSPRRTRDQHSSNASAGGTYPSRASVNKSSSNRHSSPRRTRDQHSSNASVGGTYPSRASVNTSSSSRHGSHCARDQHSSNASVGSDSQAPVYASSSSRHGSRRAKNQEKMIFVD